jgi:hypothetical protein
MITWRQGIILVMALLLAGSSGCDEITSKLLPHITAQPTNKKWQDPVRLGGSTYVLQNPRVAVSGHLDAMNHWQRFATVAWAEVPFPMDPQYAFIHARNFTWRASTGWQIEPPPPSGWGPDIHIGPVDNYDVSPDVASDRNGNALAVWHGKQNIFVNTYDQGNGVWTFAADHPNSIRYNTDYSYTMHPPRLAMNASGGAIVVWNAKERSRNENLFVYAKTSNYPWNLNSTTSPITLNVTPSSYTDRNPPQVAIDPHDSALAVWEEHNAIYYNYRVANAGGRPIVSGPHNLADEYPRVALDGAGNGLAVWLYQGKILAGRFTPGAGGQWEGQPQEISAPQTGASAPRLAMQQAPDRPGQGIALWVQGGKGFDPAAGGWEDQPRALSNPGGAVSSPAIAMNDSGNAVAVWLQQAGGEDGVFAAYFTPRFGWGGPVPLKTASGSAAPADVAIYPDGNALAVWKQLYGQSEHAIFARFYAPPLR